MADNPRQASSSTKNRTIRSQKIATIHSPPSAERKYNDEDPDRPSIARSHTPGHLASKSHSGSSDRRRKASEPSIRQRSQSVTAKSPYATPPAQSAPTPSPTPAPRSNGDSARSSVDPPGTSSTDRDSGPSVPRRNVVMRSTSAIASKTTAAAAAPPPRNTVAAPPRSRDAYQPFPALQDPKTAPDVPAAPSSGMYWSRAPVSGAPHPPLRAHTTTLVGSNVFVFGGCDSRSCFNELWVLDADSFHWSRPHVAGDVPLPLRAMTCTAVGKKLVVFGGGDGPSYYNTVYVLDTVNFRWHKPRIVSEKLPSPRRAHTACAYKNGVYVFGGGDGVRALNDVWRLDVSDMNKMSWKLISGPSTSSSSASSEAGSRPKARGYHTANMVGSKLIVYGGSDGGECFDDVWVYDVDTHVWRTVDMPITFRRLSHTSTIVGSFLFVLGGHDGAEYSNEVLLLNLVTMTWDRRRIYGLPPSGRGYHGTVLHDSRLLVIGGFDGGEVFRDVWLLELAVHSYYSQISHFSIDV